MDFYTGISVIENLDSFTIQTIYKDKKILSDKIDKKLYENEYVVLKSAEEKSALGRKHGDYIYLLDKKIEKEKVSGISPRNKEQIMMFDSLLDPDLTCVCVTGKAGSGKSLGMMATALHQVEQGMYGKIIIVRHLLQVGHKDTIGFLPGSYEEKLNPYFMGVLTNFEHLIGGKKNSLQTLIDLYSIEFHALATMRGASLSNSIILVEEAQLLDEESLLTIGTRVSEGSKICISGDLAQIDGPLKGKKEKTGLFKFINHETVKNSSFCSSIHLLKSERGPTATLFSDVFEAT